MCSGFWYRKLVLVGFWYRKLVLVGFWYRNLVFVGFGAESWCLLVRQNSRPRKHRETAKNGACFANVNDEEECLNGGARNLNERDCLGDNLESEDAFEIILRNTCDMCSGFKWLWAETTDGLCQTQ